ncbi:aminodeoxychorismate lyase [Bacillus methanolicus]|uniref:Aminodeoxychorismate lyase n=1 Tax=Bacillus methanolicus (strain MGA3 / ATCC 53907) TaxID=796606 RepID=I3EC60_BACMM|nr:aminodeoxychorismate lyase [Bacillus methanolicus]AIE58603.1 Aminodeoxychorismate lyase [Bacillus methanolicus MGA3]EIJ84081.1 4-amino-4-deoxychorismate lyase [Bacillus methanolicus MGA3]UQD50698.1 4-amino-4-deoxychorismate lyase [Bacillus methanolicus]
MYIYINGKFVKENEATISPFDHGFLYGLGLFETFRIYDGHPFLLDDHLERLNSGLKTINISAKYSRSEIVEILTTLMEKNGWKNAYIRLNVSAGNGEVGLQTDPYERPNVIIFSKPLPSAGELVEKEISILNIKRNTPETDFRLKSHHFLNNFLAKREIGNNPGCEGIFLTEEGFLAEGIVSNIFWVKRKTLYTPSVKTGILNGVTRQFVMKLAEKWGFEIQEGFYRPEDIENAEEIFLTNSIQEVVPVSNFHKKQMAGLEGKTVRMLHREFRKYCMTLWSRNEIV